ncbi:DUF3768 domain-containing protein [Salipiger pentaromativorans]|uniref:DUF3768 domain-containing protein n=1 Tax=Salipiger pentaromativorans TaxID=2943193 RepID=UPI002157110D|nr:DUF3768 domain-containing protein [Salipiger pentaromativorans]
MGSKKLNIWDMVGAHPICRSCGSRQVLRTTEAEWSMATQSWQIKTLCDKFTCDNCGDRAVPDWQFDEAFRQKRIRRLNDLLRHGQAEKASIMLTPGVREEGETFVRTALNRVAQFDAFSADNDPHGEHDFGSFEIDGKKLFFKIDYFDLELERHSDDAANPALTHRVLTIMLASEY